jgi:nicotinic acid mononucleotide adenylyltransferase
MTCAMTPLAISSTAIRDLAGQGASIRYLTADPVVEYIRTHRLYSPDRTLQETLVPDTAR